MMNTNGYILDPPSRKDWVFGKHESTPKSKTSDDVDLRPYSVNRHNQRSTGSCVAQSVVKAIEIGHCLNHGVDNHVDFSTLFLYWMARNYMNPPQTDRDDGTYIRAACDAARLLGVCREESWPFFPGKTLFKPSWEAVQDAYKGRVNAFYRINGKGRVKKVIQALQAGCPVVYGCNVDSSWHHYRAGSGVEVLRACPPGQGRHATVLAGYKDGLFIGENSWGSEWGYNGFYYLHPSVIADVGTRDIWALNTGS